MAAHKVQSGRQFACTAGDVHADPLPDTRGHEMGAGEEIRAGDESAHHVVGAHHLRATVRAKGLEDVVLSGVGEAVEQQVDGEKQETPRHVGLVRPGRLPVLLARVQSEDGDAGRDGRHDEVLVQRVALAENGDVEEHDGQQLAALGQQEGDVVDVRETGVPKGAGQTAGDGDEGQRAKDAARWDDGRRGRALGSREEEVSRADRRCK